jgi:hypothetical protein
MDYKEYLENIKNKLDAMNRASGFNPEANKEFQQNMGNSHDNMPSNEIFDMLGNGAKLWMEKNKNLNNL